MAPRLGSMSNHRLPYGDELQRIFLYGDGFKDVTAVMIGDTMVQQLWVDSETIMTIEVPHLVTGASYWVQIHTLDGSSPCENDGQMLTVDAISDTPAAELTVTGLQPEEIALGRHEQYWVLGTGLSKATLAILGDSTPCRIESYDDERLILTVPEEIDGATDGATMVLTISSPEKQVELQVVVRTGAAPAFDPYADAWPGVTSVEPAELPAAGGTLTLHGYRLEHVTVVLVGDVHCAVQDQADAWLTAAVPAMDAHAGEQLAVTVATADWASPALDNPPTVLIGG